LIPSLVFAFWAGHGAAVLIPVRSLLQVATLGSSSTGLNLTCANRVLLVEPWWNRKREDQAFARVRRILQEKPTHLVRVMVRSSIESDIVALQDEKEGKITGYLGDGHYTPTGATPGKREYRSVTTASGDHGCRKRTKNR